MTAADGDGLAPGANAEQGIVYVAFGDKYHHECRRSLTSVRKTSPAVRVAVITDREWEGAPQPDLFVIRPRVEGFRCKPLYIHEASPFERTLFLDTDTVIARDIEPVFGLLRHYDIGVRFGGPQLNEPDGLELHTQCSSGVIVFRKSAAVEALFADWLETYEAAVGAHQSADRRGLNDQRYLAIAIARSAARPAHLAEYLNFGLFETIATPSPPVVYHSRKPFIEAVAAHVNGTWSDPVNDYQMRVWLPNLAGFLPNGIRRSDPLLALAILLRRAWNELRWRIGR